MRKIALLGSTGSIGTQTLEVCAEFGYPVYALACGQNFRLLAEQSQRFRPALLCVESQVLAERLQTLLVNAPHQARILWGEEGLKEIAQDSASDTLLAAMVGISGLKPVLQAIKAGKDIALANKEVLVTGGHVVAAALAKQQVSLLPVDSEHSAIWQCMWGNDAKSLRRIFLTASGGPFLNYSEGRMAEVRLKDALKHPTWDMGGKITIDSATLMNKGLELIEAMHLFRVKAERIEVIIHPQSIIHSMVEWEDGSVIAQLSHPDMKLPIQIALAYPERLNSPSRQFNPYSPAASELTFAAPDRKRFPCLEFAETAAKTKKSLAIVMNAANELAVEAFLQERIRFTDIAKTIAYAMDKHSAQGLSEALSLEEILAWDEKGRALAKSYLSSLL